MPPHLCRLFPLALVALVACGDDASPGPRVESLGDGPANGAPLWVPRPGPLGPGRTDAYAISEDLLIDGRRVFAAGYAGPTPGLESQLAPAEPYFVRFYSRRDDGIYLEGDTRAGLYAEPVLFVPATVRVGMRWSHPPRWSFEVIGRSDRQPTDWLISVFDRERRTTNAENTKVLLGQPYVQQLTEGSPIGPYAFTRGVDAWLAQDAPPAVAAPIALPSLALRELNGGEPIAAGLVPSYVGAVVDPVDGHVSLTVDGLSTGLENSGFTGAFFTSGEATFCGNYDPAADRVIDDDAVDCRDARGTIVDGTRARAIRNERWQRYHYCVPGVSPDGLPTCNPERGAMAGIFRATDGTVRVFRVEDRIQLAPHVGDAIPMGAFGFNVDAAWELVPDGGTQPDLSGALWIPEEDASGWNLLTVEGQGLRAAHLSRDGVVDAVSPLRDEGGNLGIASDRAGRRVLRTHPDGRIERITWDRDGIRREPLGTIGLRRDRVLAGAVELGDRLLIVTLHGFEGTDPQYDTSRVNVGADRAVRPEAGELRLWEADVPASVSAPLPASELMHLDAALDLGGEDVALCGFSGEAPSDGWTVMGSPALALPHREQCLTLVTDKALELDRSGRVRGRLPALGPFMLELPFDNGRREDIFQPMNPWFGAVPLSGGGYAVCSERASESCVRWRTFDAAWRVLGDQAEPPALAPVPDLSACATAAGATCSVHSLALLDCRGPGARGPVLLPDIDGPLGTEDRWQLDGCWPVGDTLWLQLEQVDRGRFRMWRVDTRTWTITEAPVDASALDYATLDPEGQNVVLFFHDGTLMVRLREDGLDRFNLPSPGGGVASFAGPLILASRTHGSGQVIGRLWRPDLPQAVAPTCGDGTYDDDERCPADAACEPGVSACRGDYRETCNDRGTAVLENDCTVVCDAQSCHGSGRRCHAGACVPVVACGELICQPGESCVGHPAPHCTVLTRCGDGVCEPEEDEGSCVDCALPDPWDGVCIFAEQGASDCAVCGDGACHEGELERCPSDCVGCGDGVCQDGELEQCPADCPGCGNHVCEGAEGFVDVPETYCALDCSPCEADRPGCFRAGVVACDANGAIADYTPCVGGCEAGACVP